MNSLIILPAECVDQERVLLLDKRAEYGYETHGLRAGQTVKSAVLGSHRCRAFVVSASKQKVEILLRDLETEDHVELTAHNQGAEVHLIVGLSRPQTVKKVLQAAAILGAKSLHFVKSERGEKSYLQSTALDDAQIQFEIVKGLEQVWDPIPPRVSVHRDFSYFEREHLRAIAPLSAIKLLAHPGGDELSAIQHNFEKAQFAGVPLVEGDEEKRPVVVAVGPEKGWSNREVETLKKMEFHMIGLGPRVMRVELALVFLFGQLHALKV